MRILIWIAIGILAFNVLIVVSLVAVRLIRSLKRGGDPRSVDADEHTGR